MLINEAVAESVQSLSFFIHRLSEVAKQSDSQLVLSACQELVEYARTTGQVPDRAAAGEMLELLRGSRHFEALSVVADALIRMGRDELTVSRHYVQGLIDQGLLIAAREVLGGVLRRATDDPKEYSEARGLMGRVNKQIISMPALDRAIWRGGLCARRSHATAKSTRRIPGNIYGTA